MTNLMLINETISLPFSPIVLDILTVTAILCALLVIVTRNPVISVLYLIGLFVNIAAYLIYIGLNFIGLAYITVYVGAIAILFLFVIFLLDIKLAELQQDNITENNSRVVQGLIGIGFLYPLYSLIPANLTEMKSISYYILNILNSLLTKDKDILIELTNNDFTKINVQSVFISQFDGNLASFSQISSLGNIMYSNYFLWFIIAALILLLAMVAAISLTYKPNLP